LRNLGGGKNAAFNLEMVSKEEEEKKVLFVFVCVISRMMVNVEPKFLLANEIEEE
jgi:hypothetical protein